MPFSKKIDTLGRIVIPAELRSALGINPNDSLDMVIEDNNLVLSKNLPSCSLCKSTKDVIQHESGFICKKCIQELIEKI